MVTLPISMVWNEVLFTFLVKDELLTITCIWLLPCGTRRRQASCNVPLASVRIQMLAVSFISAQFVKPESVIRAFDPAFSQALPPTGILIAVSLLAGAVCALTLPIQHNRPRQNIERIIRWFFI